MQYAIGLALVFYNLDPYFILKLLVYKVMASLCSCIGSGGGGNGGGGGDGGTAGTWVLRDE